MNAELRGLVETAFRNSTVARGQGSEYQDECAFNAAWKDLREAVAALSVAQGQGCVWTLDETESYSIWESACGESWSFTEGGVEDNNVRFCHGCGKPVIAEVPARDHDEDEQEAAAPAQPDGSRE